MIAGRPMIRGLTGALACALSLAAASAAHAGTGSGTMQVRLEVVDACSVTAAPLQFTMTKDAVVGATAESRIDLNCTPGTQFSVAIDSGAHAAGGGKRMYSEETGDYVGYEIFSDAARTASWGGNADTGMPGTSGRSGQTTLLAYGRVENGGATLRPGTYSDTVIVTVHF